MSRFDEIKIGQRAELKRIIRQDDIDKFIEITGDNNKLHIDKEFTSKTTFKKPVVHGMLGASFISTVIGTKLPGDGALWYSQSLEFLLPVRIGDTITISAEVIKKNERLNVIELKTVIYNQHRQKVTTGTAKVKIIEQEVSPEKVEKNNKESIVLVIGGSGGIGSATCFQLAKDGFSVAVHYYKNIERAKELKYAIKQLGQKSMVVNADITNETQIKEMVDQVIREFGSITAVVNCATLRIPTIAFSDLKWVDMQRFIDINVKGFFYISKNIIPIMKKQKYGIIINIITQLIEIPQSKFLHYITAKSALHGFSKALALELASFGIRVNTVSPGMTDTELISDFPEKAKLLAIAQTPLKRIARPDDVAGAISFLVSEKSNFITGESIRVNGGQVML